MRNGRGSDYITASRRRVGSVQTVTQTKELSKTATPRNLGNAE